MTYPLSMKIYIQEEDWFNMSLHLAWLLTVTVDCITNQRSIIPWNSRSGRMREKLDSHWGTSISSTFWHKLSQYHSSSSSSSSNSNSNSNSSSVRILLTTWLKKIHLTEFTNSSSSSLWGEGLGHTLYFEEGFGFDGHKNNSNNNNNNNSFFPSLFIRKFFWTVHYTYFLAGWLILRLGMCMHGI